MRITRVQTRQGHPVPKAAYRSKGPFPEELYTRVAVHDSPEQSDGGGLAIPLGATSQNGWQEVRLMVCSLCRAEVPANATESHSCA